LPFWGHRGWEFKEGYAVPGQRRLLAAPGLIGTRDDIVLGLLRHIQEAHMLGSVKVHFGSGIVDVDLATGKITIGGPPTSSWVRLLILDFSAEVGFDCLCTTLSYCLSNLFSTNRVVLFRLFVYNAFVLLVKLIFNESCRSTFPGHHGRNVREGHKARNGKVSG
jgi:hypothetical protein